MLWRFVHLFVKFWKAKYINIYEKSMYYFPVGVKGEVQAISSYTDSSSTVHVIVTHNTTGNRRSGANFLTTFEVTEEVMRGKGTF